MAIISCFEGCDTKSLNTLQSAILYIFRVQWMRAKHISVLLVGFLASLLAISSVFAAPINWQPLGDAARNIWQMLGTLFTSIPSDPVIRQGILKFLIFILLLRVVQMAAKVGMKSFLPANDEKTPVIVGIVVAATTVFFTPNTILLSGVIMVVIPLAIVLGLVYFAFKTEFCTKDRLHHFFGVLIMLFAAYITEFLIEIYKNPTSAGIAAADIPPFVHNILSFLQMAVWILFLVKIIYWLANGKFALPGTNGSGSGGGSGGSGGGSGGSGSGSPAGGPGNPAQPRPPAPSNIKVTP
jgi:hypothetical protein